MKFISLALIALVVQAGHAPPPAGAARELTFNWPVGIEQIAELREALPPASLAAAAMPVPMFPGMTAPSAISTGLVDFTPCTRGGAQRECANLLSRQTLDQKSLSALMQKFMAAIGDKDLASIKYERMNVVNVLRIRLEVDTTLPHELSFERTAEMAFSEPGGQRADLKQIDRRASKFVY